MTALNKIEYAILLDRLTETLMQRGVSVSDVNREIVRLSNLNEFTGAILDSLGGWLGGKAVRMGLRDPLNDYEFRQQFTGLRKALDNFFTAIDKTAPDQVTKELKKKINVAINTLYSHSREKMYGVGQSPYHKPVAQLALDRLQKEIYGPSGTGADGDFSGFREPEAAKRYFMRYFSGKPADPLHFARYLRLFGHKDRDASAK